RERSADTRAYGPGELRGVHTEVRCSPYDTAVPDQQRLRGFVPDTQLRAHRIRDLTMSLHRHHRIADVRVLLVEVQEELIERFCADATCVAVLEQQDRLGLGVDQ